MSTRRHAPSDAPRGIDPFNAPDPIMPGGEPTFDDAEDESPDTAGNADSNYHQRKRSWRAFDDASPSKRLSAARTSTRVDTQTNAQGNGQHAASGSSHYRTKPYQAPVEHPDAYEAPNTDGTPGTVAAERAGHALKQAKRAAKRAQQRAGERKRNRGCLVAVLVIFLISGGISLLEGACSAAFDAVDEALFSSPQGSYHSADDASDDSSDEYRYGNGLTYDEADQLENDAEQAVRSQAQSDLTALVADADGTLATRLSEEFADSFQSYSGTSLEAAGIDSHEVARWVLDNTTYDVTDSLAYFDSYDALTISATAYFDATAPDIDDVAYYVSSYIFDTFSDRYRSNMTFTADEQAKLAQTLEDAEARALAEAETRSYFMQNYDIDASTSPMTITRYEEGWQDNIQSLFRLW